jgi:guanine deaminase
MFISSPRIFVGLPALWLALAVLNACAMAATYPYTVYRGTFIQFPRLNSTTVKPELARTQGALWVGDDGRIKGYDWTVRDDASFKSFLSSHSWADADATNANSKATKVKVVQSNDSRNEFFFPGFIGMPQF